MIFVHGNSSCRLESNSLAEPLLRAGLALLCYDQNACGLSEGSCHSMGLREAEDLAKVVDFARSRYPFRRLALWGRSMGAFTVLRYLASEPQKVVAAVIDSAYCELKPLIVHVAKSRAYAPEFILSPLVNILFKEHQIQTGLDLHKCEVLSSVQRIKDTSLLFLCSEEDDLVPHSHSERLFEAAVTPCKQLVKIPGSHVATRSRETIELCLKFLDRRGKSKVNVARSRSRSPPRPLRDLLGSTTRCRFSSPEKIPSAVQLFSKLPIRISYSTNPSP